MSESPAPVAADKLTFLLSLVPYLIDHDNVSVADVADQDERRPAVIGRQRPRILLGLFAGVAHEHVPASMRAAATAAVGVWQDRQAGE